MEKDRGEVEDDDCCLEMEEALGPTLPQERVAGGWKSIKYILGNESFEKLASMSMVANLTVYLQTKYNMDGILVINVYHLWSGSSNLTPLAGAFLSDGYLGRYRTLLYGSIASFLGVGTMAMTAKLPQLRPAACDGGVNCEQAQSWQLVVLYVGLALLAVGSGGIRPCNIAFGADQFDTQTAMGRAQLQSFFNWWYFSFTVALLIALSVVAYVQSNVSWVAGYGIPTACLFFSISIFLVGKRSYIMKKAQGSVFVDVTKVIVAALRKRRVPVQAIPHAHLLHDPPSAVESRSNGEKLARTDKFRFFDRAALIVRGDEVDGRGVAEDSWRLCSVQQVEELKLLLGVVPVLLTGIGCFVAMEQMNTFGVMQAIQADNRIGSFRVPPAWMGLASMLCLSTWIFIYEQVYLPRAAKLSGRDMRFTMKRRINTGIVLAILCMLAGATAERRRRRLALESNSFVSPMSIFFLLPQFALTGFNEAFSAVALMEYFTTHLPESMRTVAGAIFFLSFSATSYLNTFLVNIIHRITGTDGRTPWLGGRDLNKARIDNYFFFIAALSTLNLLYFNLFSCHYLQNNTQPKSRAEQEEQHPTVREEAD